MTRSADPVLVTMLALSLAGNVYQYRSDSSPAQQPTYRGVTAGDRMPPLKGIDLKGRPVSVAPSSKPLIVYVFHSACGWCERNLDNIEALAAATDGDYEFVAATAELAGIDEYLAARSLSWRVVAGVSHKLLTEYGVAGTPYTLVLSRDGKVEHAWTGAFDESKSAEVSRVFGVKLPGLRPPKS